MKLHGRHDEAIGHEAGKALEVERWRRPPATGRGEHFRGGIAVPVRFLVQVADLDGEEVFIGVGAVLGARADGGEGLGDGVGDAAEDLNEVVRMILALAL